MYFSANNFKKEKEGNTKCNINSLSEPIAKYFLCIDILSEDRRVPWLFTLNQKHWDSIKHPTLSEGMHLLLRHMSYAQA